MRRFLFTVRIIGKGNSKEDAWNDAIESFGTYSEPLPDDNDIREFEEDIWRDE